MKAVPRSGILTRPGIARQGGEARHWAAFVQSVRGVLLLGALLGACGEQTPDEGPPVGGGTPERPSADAMEAIRRTGKVVVAVHVDSNHKIFCFGTTKPEGFDIDFANGLVDRLRPRLAETLSRPGLDVTVEFHFVESWARLLHSLVSREHPRFDLAIASISRTPDRESQGILFSNPYLETELGAICRTADPNQDTSISQDLLALDELRARRVGVHGKTTADAFLGSLPGVRTGSLDVFETNDELFQWKCHDGRPLDIIVYDLVRSVPEAFSSRKGFVIHRIEGRENRERETYCVAFRPGNEVLRGLVNEIIPPATSPVVSDNTFEVPLVTTHLAWVQSLIAERIKSTLGTPLEVPK